MLHKIYAVKVDKHVGNICCGLLKVAKTKGKKSKRKYSHKNLKLKEIIISMKGWERPRNVRAF